MQSSDGDPLCVTHSLPETVRVFTGHKETPDLKYALLVLDELCYFCEMKV